MRTNNSEKLDLSFLPLDLASQMRGRLKLTLEGLNKIRYPIRAAVLGGGYKNKELTYTQDEMMSDIDLFVFSNFIPFFWKRLVKIQKEINGHERFFHYRGVVPLFLSKSKTFWAYRLKEEGIVLKGDTKILQRIQARRDNIPKIEAIRILFQNLVVWLTLAELENKDSAQDIDEFTVLRSYLNIGESYLTFFGCLEPSYRKRMEEFRKRACEFGLNKGMAEKIILGYLIKVNPEQAKKECENFHLSMPQAKQDCIEVIDRLLSLHLNTNVSLVKKLDVLGKKIRPRWFFNLAFFWFLRDLKSLKPRFFSIVFTFKITDLWKMVVDSSGDEKEKFFKKYFKAQKFSDRMIIKIFEAHPSLSTVEII